MVALRYDIGVRSNAFSHHMTKNGSDYVSNIGIFRKDIADLSKATAVNLEEMVFQDNPYSPGGIRESWDPVTGKPKGKKNSNENFELSGVTVNGLVEEEEGEATISITIPAQTKVLPIITL
ncbi:hypothetical protein PCANC_16336 [Puccinia coronata f. sp. avenae]|uniref:Uncharacterized protein n=1 Tax=Puccinia coronata f. sp. avenae TaxID=200324 RepID=A0A2N5SK24_9BASI|nr:hypothetical protein PCANC_16336 [Puccinia coronata f. sp. avenae]